jgi:ureidoglycolate hydrolase
MVKILQFLVPKKFQNFGDIIGKGLVSKCVIKGGSHLNLSLCYEIGANNNDAIVLWNTFITCSCMS